MSLRICATPGCPAFVTAGKCADCSRTADRERGTSTARGYGARHQRLRAMWQARMDKGEQVTCWRCREAGRPHVVDPRDWQLGHDDEDRTKYRGPECSAGNQATASRRR